MGSFLNPAVAARDLGTPDRDASRFRPDIEGLRAVAIVTVLLYHAGVTLVPGGFIGVDVFFVISGFLITGLLLREVEQTGRISLTRFYARRAKRLLPAAALVLATTAVLVLTVASTVDRKVFGGDITAAAAYVLNWRLAERSVDYLAEGVGVSPVQHFWSLSVEEQFYLLWPMLLVVIAVVARRRKASLRPAMAAGLTAIVLPSFVWSIIHTADTPAGAFFVTPTRLWELGVGGLVAVGATVWARIPKPMGRVLGPAGLIVIAATALLVDAKDPWPGQLAAIPVIAAAAVIVAGSAGTAPRLLSSGAAVWVGALSYSLYLWHWPLLTAAEWKWGDLGQGVGLLVATLAFLPAWLSYRFVEQPVRQSRRLARAPRRTLTLGAGLTAIGVAAGLILMALVPAPDHGRGSVAAARGAQSLAWDGDRIVGVKAITKGPDALAPPPDAAVADVPRAYPDGCQAESGVAEPHHCLYGDLDGRTRLVVAGDSKALQWSDAIAEIGKARGWRIDLATKSGCAFADAYRHERDDWRSCQAFNAALVAELLAEPPDAVIVSQRHSTATAADGSLDRQVMVDGLVRAWTPLTRRGIRVIALMDNPAPRGIPGDQVYRCVADHRESLADCSFSRSLGAAGSGTSALRAAARSVPGVRIVDMADALCTAELCPPVIGGVLVYRQGSHVTNTYALSARPFLERRLVAAVG